MDHIVVPGLSEFEDRWHFSHVVRDGERLYLSGVTGTGEDGRVDPDPARQFEQAFVHLDMYLSAAAASMQDIVELTTYHVDLRDHLTTFMEVKDRHICRPYPAWSAIGVSQLITDGALVELRVIARSPDAST